MSTATAFTSRQVMDMFGLSFRQVDHLARTCLSNTPGSGVRRMWDPETVRLLQIAKRLSDTCPKMPGHAGGMSLLTMFIRIVCMAGDPPETGWVGWHNDEITYAASLGEMPIGPGAVVARIPELEP